MKTYNVTLTPSIFELPGYSDIIYEHLDFSHFSESLLQEGEFIKMSRTVEADNIEDALAKICSHLRCYEISRSSSSARILCYDVYISYFYGCSLREKSFKFWISRGTRRYFLKKNRSYLTDDQIDSILFSSLPSFDRYLIPQ